MGLKKRPSLGTPIFASDRIYRHWMRESQREVHKSRGVVPGLKAQPVFGIYVGWRTIQNGRMVWDGDGHYWVPDEWVECWLVVVDERKNPIRVFPKDVIGWGDRPFE